MALIHKIQKKYIFIILVSLYILIFYPRFMSEDSLSTYASAQSGIYKDSIPPTLSWVWGVLDTVYPGPALMFLMNMALLWSGVYMLAFHLVKTNKLFWITVLIPYTPWIMTYAGFIWKDVIFTFGYGLLAMILCVKDEHQKCFSFPGSILFFGLLFYATSVKYQAQFVAPFMCFWFCRLQWPRDRQVLKFLKAALFSASIGLSLFYVDQKLIPAEGRTHFWQYVKIYDLAGISVRCDKILLPNFLVRTHDLKVIRKKYDFLWEPLIRYPDSPLRETKSDAERSILQKTWQKAVISHPFSYLAHRFWVFFQGTVNGPYLKLILGRWGRIFSYSLLFPVQLWFAFSRHFSFSVRYLNRMGLSLMAILFIFSLAGTPRYIYFSIYLFFLSVPLALQSYQVKS